MKMNELLDTLREKCLKADISGIDGVLAFQFDLTGVDSGTFYIEVKDGVLSIEPYEYNDRNAKFIMENETFVKIMDKKLDPMLAFTIGKLKIEGDVVKALELNKFLK